jgi:outer membrane protein, heavy metal efflux system
MSKKYCRRPIVASALIISLTMAGITGRAQSLIVSDERPVSVANDIKATKPTSPILKYSDPQAGMTVDQAVAYALEHNGELLAARKEIEAVSALVRQAALRANPTLDTSVAKTVNGSDNNVMIQGTLPLELGGRRSARIKVAEREFEMRRQDIANRERLLAADVRTKFGQAIAAILKLGFDQDLVEASQRGYNLVAARVTEGGTAPLEQNMVLVELNRLRSVREVAEGKTQVAMLELRNVIGMAPDEPLQVRGNFDDLINPLTPLAEATERALAQRPDLKLTKTAESLAEARIEQARAEGKLDASLSAGYQRMDSSFPLDGINDAGQLMPIRSTFNYLTFGLTLNLPLRNKNQGAIEAAIAEADAAKRRREFTELTIRREVASAYAQYNSDARAAEIFRVGVKGQASTNLNVVRQTYELGSKTLIDYLVEQRRYIELQNSYIDTLLETYKARVEVERALGSSPITKPETQIHD